LGPMGPLLEDWGVQFTFTGLSLHRNGILGAGFMLAIAWFLPNTQQIMARYKPAFEIYSKEIKPVKWQVLQWKPNLAWASISALFFFYVVLSLSKVSEFLYFQF
jgi:alginate O-acetyltransferase complex protein AlgI